MERWLCLYTSIFALVVRTNLNYCDRSASLPRGQIAHAAIKNPREFFQLAIPRLPVNRV